MNDDIKIGVPRRWEFTWGQPSSPQNKILGHIGPYDVYHDNVRCSYTVACDPRVAGGAGRAFTEYEYEGDTLVPRDTDVVLDPYHMCLLYQLVAAIGDPVRT